MKKLKAKAGQTEHTAEFLGGAADAPETEQAPPRRAGVPKRKYATYYMLADNLKRVKVEARRNREYPVYVIDRALALYFSQTGGSED